MPNAKGVLKNGLLPLSRVVDEFPNSTFSSNIKSLKTSILLNHPAAQYRSIGIISCSRREGRSTIAINLAYAFCEKKIPTNLIDADLCQGALSALLLDEKFRKSDTEVNTVKDVDKELKIELSNNLTFISALSDSVDNNFQSNRKIGSIEDLIRNLSSSNNIIVDLPPLDYGSETIAISKSLDGVIFIIGAGRTTIEDAVELINEMHYSQIKILGAVLNKARPDKFGLKRL